MHLSVHFQCRQFSLKIIFFTLFVGASSAPVSLFGAHCFAKPKSKKQVIHNEGNDAKGAE